jgi:hypothetical protein
VVRRRETRLGVYVLTENTGKKKESGEGDMGDRKGGRVGGDGGGGS